MYNLPIEFSTTAKATSDFEQTWISNSGESQTVCCIPNEFGGHGGGLSPEDLFLQAATNCFIGTFKVIAKLSKLNYSDILVNSKLVVDKNTLGKTIMKSIHLDISVFNSEKNDRFTTIIEKSIRDGFILNSIKSEISYSINFY